MVQVELAEEDVVGLGLRHPRRRGGRRVRYRPPVRSLHFSRVGESNNVRSVQVAWELELPLPPWPKCLRVIRALMSQIKDETLKNYF